jgi:hypothetical protein
MKKRFSLEKFIRKQREKLFILAVAFVVVLSIPIGFRLNHRNDPVILGVSFSIKAANELGLDWKKTYLSLLDEVQVKQVRLMSYWDLGEPANNEYMFDDLDWQIDQANRHNVSVSLAVGQRQPRWPECHIPSWTDEVDEATRNNELLEYIEIVVNRYKDNPAVTSYQVENEAANSNFGICPDYNEDLLEQEIKLVKRLDTDADVITNVGDQLGFITGGPAEYADKVGFSIYHNAYTEVFGRQLGYRFFLPSHWHSGRAALIEGGLGKPVLVHELQAEPWGPRATQDLTIEEQDRSMSADRIRSQVEFAKQSGIKEIYLWGGEWWYWRHTKFDDDYLWQTVKDIYSEN